MKFYNQIAYDDTYYSLTTIVPEGDRLADTLKDKRIAIRTNHGVMVTGPPIAHALYYLGRAAPGKNCYACHCISCVRTFEQMRADRDGQSIRFFKRD